MSWPSENPSIVIMTIVTFQTSAVPCMDSLNSRNQLFAVAGYVGKILSKKIICFECNKALGSAKGPTPDKFLTLKEFVPDRSSSPPTVL